MDGSASLDGAVRLPTRSGEVEERFAGPDEARVRYAEAGEGAPVVLIHGALTCLEDMLLGPFDRLAERYRVIAVDRPGHGRTARPRLHGTLAHQGDRIRAALQDLGAERPILVGHSRGAAVALDLAIRFPDTLAGLVLLGPLFLPEARVEHALFGPRATPALGEMVNTTAGRVIDVAVMPLLWESMFAPLRMPEHFRDRFPFAMATRPEVMLGMGEEAVQVLPELARNMVLAARCPVPARVLAGSVDLIINPWQHALMLGSALPRARHRVLPGLGHMLQHQAVDEIVEAVDALAHART